MWFFRVTLCCVEYMNLFKNRIFKSQFFFLIIYPFLNRETYYKMMCPCGSLATETEFLGFDPRYHHLELPSECAVEPPLLL